MRGKEAGEAGDVEGNGGEKSKRWWTLTTRQNKRRRTQMGDANETEEADMEGEGVARP